jgi:hypothetical protein
VSSNKPEPYAAEKIHKWATGGSLYLLDDPLKPGEVVRVTHLAGKFDNVATTEYIVLGYYNGHAYVELYKAKPAVAGDWVHWNGNVWLREGQYAYVYTADVANAEKQYLIVDGRRE